MPSAWRLLWTPPSGSVQAQDTAPAQEGPQPPLSPRCPWQGPCVPVACGSLQDQAPLSRVRNLLRVRQEPRWAQEHLRNSSTALAFPKAILVLVPTPQHHTPSKLHPSDGHRARRLSSLLKCSKTFHRREHRARSTNHIPRAPG